MLITAIIAVTAVFAIFFVYCTQIDGLKKHHGEIPRTRPGVIADGVRGRYLEQERIVPLGVKRHSTIFCSCATLWLQE